MQSAKETAANAAASAKAGMDKTKATVQEKVALFKSIDLGLGLYLFLGF